MVHSDETVRIAHWFRDYEAAVSLRFDDGFKSQKQLAVPLLDRYDFKATFMVNPGRERYKKDIAFWEDELPKKGHRLGNHTMHHNGARTIEEAEYEVGEVSRKIWKIYPRYSKLNVFASGGGGQQWGGKRWSAADEGYKRLMDKYHLIDLYDGHHPSYQFQAKSSNSEVFQILEKDLKDKRHQAFHFHEIEENWVKNWIKEIVSGANLNIRTKQLSDLLERLQSLRETVWVATIIDILKYEEERNQARIESIVENGSVQKFRITAKTDPQLYDHLLTLVVPTRQGMVFERACQNDKAVSDTRVTSSGVMLNIKPISSDIHVHSHRK